MPLSFPKPEPVAECVKNLPRNDCILFLIKTELLVFQANTIEALADYLIVEARKFELANKTITFEELKAAAKKLKDYAQELAPGPSAPREATV